MLAGRALIWYNTMWKGMAGSRYDDRAETEPDSVYGVLIDSLGARIIQTDRPGPLIRYLEARGQHRRVADSDERSAERCRAGFASAGGFVNRSGSCFGFRLVPWHFFVGI